MSTKNQIKSRAALTAWLGAALVWLPSLVWGWGLISIVLAGVITPLTLFVTWWAWLRTPQQVIAYRNWRADHKQGFASSLDIVRKAGRVWLFRRAARIRPSLAGASMWERWVGTHWSELGPRIMQVGTWFGRVWVFCTHEAFRVVIAGPRAGKTAHIINEILDAPGAVIATSTKAEVIQHSRAIREAAGSPTRILNSDGLGGDDCRTNLGWNPLVGCVHPAVALRRAGYFMSGAKGVSGIGADNFWQSQGVRAFGSLLHAAALGNQSIFTVERWNSRLGNENDIQEIREYLAQSESAESMLSDFMQLSGTNTNTMTSTTTTITAALAWLKDPAAAALITDDDSFDAADFINRRGTLYLIARDKEYGGVGPLFTAFVGWLYDSAVEMASHSPRGKLDPPLCMVLDEAANICALPLHRMSGDMAGQGIPATAVFQSEAQIAEKWGEHPAAVIWQNAATKLLMGGNDDPDSLDRYSRLFGDVRDRNGMKGARKRALPVERIRDLDEFEGIVIRRGMGATVGMIHPYWERPDYRKHIRTPRRRPVAMRLRALGGRRKLKELTAEPHQATVPIPRNTTKETV